ncbi:MAG: glycosyltransferase family 2 protein [Nanoarchaeota archaeon]|nr:glycosyltransferase family 2 protein [Nanoarchaeota archaeon]
MLTIFQLVLFWVIFDVPYFGYRLFLYFLHKRDVASLKSPFVSILIPAYNEEVGIAKTLDSCLSQSYPYYEIIVINDGSKDRTADLVGGFVKKYGGHIKLINQTNKGKAKALNTGLKHARGKFVITVDADSKLHPHAIERILSKFSSDKIGAVAGNVVGISHGSLLGYIQRLEYYVVTHYLRYSQSTFGSVIITPGAFSAYRRCALRKFQEGTLTEDFDSSVKILEEDYEIVSAPDALCYTQVPLNVSDLLKQRIRWHRGGLEVLSKHLFHKRRFLVSLELFFIFFFGFYGLFPRILTFVIIPLMLLSSEGFPFLTWLLFFLGYSSFVWSINLLLAKEKDIKAYLVSPLFILYGYTIILYAILAGQILVFSKNRGWGTLQRYQT